MSDDPFFERLRDDARALRREPDDVATTRMAARIRARIADRPPTVAELLARWFRPLAASLTVIALAASLGLYWTAGSNGAAADAGVIEIAVAGETYSVE